MIEKFNICGYCRISVDDELGRDNTSIENQRSIIEDFVLSKFPTSNLDFFEDRDRSGYTFEQRESYQKMRKKLISSANSILIVKDFSRFSRRNSRGLVELEDLRDAGVRIISIGDNIDFPSEDDWLKIQFQFLINEMPVTDTSKKVKSVIKRKQADAKWICSAPYGYIVNKNQEFELVPEEADVIRQIFDKYIEGYGYKKIANYLTDENIPTPRMSEKLRKEAQGIETNRKIKPEWSIITIQGILDNDFYIGTFRQGKYTRSKINGNDVKLDESNHLVFENHHQEIISYKTFRIVKNLREKRTNSHYRGVKKYDNVYSGIISCGDCGSPMFAMSRADIKDAYRCGTYHKRGLKGCTSHHIRVDKIDELLKSYIAKVRENSADMIEILNKDLENERKDVTETENSMKNLDEILVNLQDELKATKRQRIRDIVKRPEQEDILNETYDELEDELANKIIGIKNQIEISANRRNTIIRVNRVTKTALDIFDDIINKEKLTKADIEFIVDDIKVYENHIEISLKADIDAIIRCDNKEIALNFNLGTINNSKIVQSSRNKLDKVYSVNVISNGDPLEIFTNKDGEVIFKKYSPLGELTSISHEMCETIAKVSGYTCAICDKDSIVSCYGPLKNQVQDERLSVFIEKIMSERAIYQHKRGEAQLSISDNNKSCIVKILAPIITEGDITGAVLIISEDIELECNEADVKLINTSALFLAKHMSH